MQEISPRLSLNLIDWKKIGKGFLIAVGGTILLTASNWLTTGNFDWQLLWTLECGAVSSTVINFFYKFLSGPAK